MACTKYFSSRDILLCQEAKGNISSRAGVAGVITAASLTTSGDRDATESKVGATAIATENVVVFAIIGGSAGNINERDAGNSDTVSWVTSWATVEVVLLDIDTVLGDAGERNILVDDVANL